MSSAHAIVAPLAESNLEPLLVQLLRLFPNRGDTHFRRVGSPTWRQMSRFHYLTDEEISASIEKDSVYVRAAALDDMTRFLVMTIPTGSRYNDKDQFSRLLTCLRALQLNPKVYRAADSEDIQVFLPFSESTDSAFASGVLSRELVKESFEIAAQSIIIHSTSEPFALPLQAKFAWLNDDLSVKVLRHDIALNAAMALFLADMSRGAVSPAVLIDRPAFAYMSLPEFIDESSNQPDAVLEIIDPPVVMEEEEPTSCAPAAERVPDMEIQQDLGAQLQLFSLPALQEPKEEPVPIRRRRPRPRSDPQAPRAEPPTNKLFPVITTDNASSSKFQRRSVKETN